MLEGLDAGGWAIQTKYNHFMRLTLYQISITHVVRLFKLTINIQTMYDYVGSAKRTVGAHKQTTQRPATSHP